MKIVFSSLLLLNLLVIGCASKEEKEERKKNAFDLAGTYIADEKTNSEINFELKIQNQTGRHDVLGTLKRVTALTNKEIDFINDRHKDLDPQAIENNFGNEYLLGEGYQPAFDGGENISDDLGETSRVFICTYQKKLTTKYSAQYCLDATMTKGDPDLKGTLTLELRWTEIAVDPDTNESHQVPKYDSLSMNFNGDSDRLFYMQYLGRWEGEIFNDVGVSENLGAFHQFDIVLTDDKKSFYLYPSDKALSFDGKVYLYEQRLFPISKLSDADRPIVQLDFVQETTKDRVSLFGFIKRLGFLGGNIMFVPFDGTEEVQLATADLVKITN